MDGTGHACTAVKHPARVVTAENATRTRQAHRAKQTAFEQQTTKQYDSDMKMQINKKEMLFARLRTEGYSPVEAYRQAFNKANLKPENCTEQAYRIDKKPQVVTMVKELLVSAKKSHILSHGQWLVMMMDSFKTAMDEGNMTAASSFGRLMGQGIGTTSETLRIDDERLTDEQLIERLGQDNPQLAEMIRKVTGAKRTFDA